MSVSIKEEWIEKLFKYDNNIYIDKVLYIDSKMYYCGRYNDKYFICYYGHSQPNIIEVIKYFNNEPNSLIDFIECDKNDIPSTVVNIEDVIEVIYNSTINDQATNIIEITNNSNKGQQLVNRINELIKKLTQLNYNKSYTISNNYNLSFYTSNCEYDEIALLSNYYRYNKNNMLNCNDYHINNFPGILGFTYLSTLDFEERLKKAVNNYFNNIKNSDDIDYHTLIIGHAIKIGEINEAFLCTRYSSISSSGLVDQFQNSIETDNHYRYRNLDRIDGILHDDLFPNITEELDDNYEIFETDENEDINYELEVEISDSITEGFNKNKFQQILEDDDEDYEVLRYVEEDNKLHGTDSDLWIIDGLKHFKGE